jgi:hypothetical protein
MWLRERAVNSEGNLGSARMALLRFLDPMEWYMRRGDIRDVGTHRRGRDRQPRGWTAYGDVTPAEGVSREQDLGRGAEDEPSSPERRQLRVEYATLLDAKARYVLAGNMAVIETTGGTIRARLIRFRSGAVIESWSRSPGSTGHAMMRMESEDLGDALSHLTSFLAGQVVNLGPDARPIG